MKRKLTLLCTGVITLTMLLTACTQTKSAVSKKEQAPFPNYETVTYSNDLGQKVRLDYDCTLTEENDVKKVWELLAFETWEKSETVDRENKQDLLLKFDGEKDVYRIYDDGIATVNDTAFYKIPKETKEQLAEYLVPAIDKVQKQERENRVLPDEIETLFAAVADMRIQTPEYIIYFEGRDDRMAEYQTALCVDTWKKDADRGGKQSGGKPEKYISLIAVQNTYDLTISDNNDIFFSIRGNEVVCHSDEPIYENLQAVLKDETGKRTRS